MPRETGAPGTGMNRPLLVSKQATNHQSAALDRFLTAQTKTAVLQDWNQQRALPAPSGDLCGRGWPDPEVIPLCDELNSFAGVCTLQSCSGHGRPGEGGLWLWLDQSTQQMFSHWAHVLARMEGIESVSSKYTDWGQEITAIDFDGRYEKASRSVLIFFRALMSRSDSSR